MEKLLESVIFFNALLDRDGELSVVFQDNLVKTVWNKKYNI